jgi:hypothetical protein
VILGMRFSRTRARSCFSVSSADGGSGGFAVQNRPSVMILLSMGCRMREYFIALLQVFAYLLVRLKLGFQLTYHEKNQLLDGFLRLGQKFIEDYYRNDQLGSIGMDLLTRSDIRLPALPERQD